MKAASMFDFSAVLAWVRQYSIYRFLRVIKIVIVIAKKWIPSRCHHRSHSLLLLTAPLIAATIILAAVTKDFILAHSWVIA